MEAVQKAMIEQLIDDLKEIKQKAENVNINVEHDMKEVASSLSGENYAVKELHIDIVYNQLYKKNENDLFDFYKPLNMRKEKTKDGKNTD